MNVCNLVFFNFSKLQETVNFLKILICLKSICILELGSPISQECSLSCSYHANILVGLFYQRMSDVFENLPPGLGTFLFTVVVLKILPLYILKLYC